MNIPYSYLTFNGTNQYVSIPRSIQNDFTIEFWFSSTQGISASNDWWNGAGLLDGKVSGYTNDLGISLNANGQVLAGVGGSMSTYRSMPSQVGLNDGTWQHVAYTRSSTTGVIQLYINGTFVSTTIGATGTNNASPRLTIGCIQLISNYFKGSIGEIKLWNTIRTLTEINDNKDLVLSGREIGLVAYYKSIIGTTLIDSTSNGNNGTIYNNANFTSTPYNYKKSDTLYFYPSVVIAPTQHQNDTLYFYPKVLMEYETTSVLYLYSSPEIVAPKSLESDIYLYSTPTIVTPKSLESDIYLYSEVTPYVPPTINIKARISDKIVAYADGWIRIDGVLKKIDSVWVKVDGVIRKN